MKKITAFAVLGVASLALAACGSSDNASDDAGAETVEMPAEEALGPVSEEPVADPDADAADPADNAVDAQTAQQAADAAASVAEEAAAAAEAAEAAANAIDVE